MTLKTFTPFGVFFFLGLKNTTFSGALGWTQEQKNKFYQSSNTLLLSQYTIQLFIECTDPNELFSIDESDINSRRVRHNFLSLVIYSDPTEAWQVLSLNDHKTTPIFNFFSAQFLKVKKIVIVESPYANLIQ